MSKTTHYATPEDVELAFYEALVKGDADAMMDLWSEEEDTVCVHPTGAQLVGFNLIRDSWRNIFHSNRLRVNSESIAHWQGMLLAIHHLVETLFIGDDATPHGPLHVTHVYSRGPYGWRLVSRHASAAGEGMITHDSDDGPRVLH